MDDGWSDLADALYSLACEMATNNDREYWSPMIASHLLPPLIQIVSNGRLVYKSYENKIHTNLLGTEKHNIIETRKDLSVPLKLSSYSKTAPAKDNADVRTLISNKNSSSVLSQAELDNLSALLNKSVNFLRSHMKMSAEGGIHLVERTDMIQSSDGQSYMLNENGSGVHIQVELMKWKVELNLQSLSGREQSNRIVQEGDTMIREVKQSCYRDKRQIRMQTNDRSSNYTLRSGDEHSIAIRRKLDGVPFSSEETSNFCLCQDPTVTYGAHSYISHTKRSCVDEKKTENFPNNRYSTSRNLLREGTLKQRDSDIGHSSDNAIVVHPTEIENGMHIIRFETHENLTSFEDVTKEITQRYELVVPSWWDAEIDDSNPLFWTGECEQNDIKTYEPGENRIKEEVERKHTWHTLKYQQNEKMTDTFTQLYQSNNEVNTPVTEKGQLLVGTKQNISFQDREKPTTPEEIETLRISKSSITEKESDSIQKEREILRITSHTDKCKENERLTVEKELTTKYKRPREEKLGKQSIFGVKGETNVSIDTIVEAKHASFSFGDQSLQRNFNSLDRIEETDVKQTQPLIKSLIPSSESSIHRKHRSSSVGNQLQLVSDPDTIAQMSGIATTTSSKIQSSGRFRTRTDRILLEKDQSVLFNDVPAIKRETCYTEITGDCTKTSENKDAELYTFRNPVKTSVTETKYRSRSKQKPLICNQSEANNKKVIENIDTVTDYEKQTQQKPFVNNEASLLSTFSKCQNYNRYRCASGNRVETKLQDPIYKFYGPFNLLSIKSETREKSISKITVRSDIIDGSGPDAKIENTKVHIKRPHYYSRTEKEIKTGFVLDTTTTREFDGKGNETKEPIVEKIPSSAVQQASNTLAASLTSVGYNIVVNDKEVSGKDVITIGINTLESYIRGLLESRPSVTTDSNASFPAQSVVSLVANIARTLTTDNGEHSLPITAVLIACDTLPVGLKELFIRLNHAWLGSIITIVANPARTLMIEILEEKTEWTEALKKVLKQLFKAGVATGVAKGTSKLATILLAAIFSPIDIASSFVTAAETIVYCGVETALSKLEKQLNNDFTLHRNLAVDANSNIKTNSVVNADLTLNTSPTGYSKYVLFVKIVSTPRPKLAGYI